MIWNTIEHARDTRPANALLTRHWNLDAICQQDIEDRQYRLEPLDCSFVPRALL